MLRELRQQQLGPRRAGDALGREVKGESMALFIGLIGDSWHARQGKPRRRVCRPDSARVRARLEVGDGPDRWGPPVGGREEGGANWAGKRSLGRVLAETGNRLQFGLRGKERKKERREIGPAGLKRDGEREKGFAFSFEIDSKLFDSNLNSGEFKLELNNKQ